MQRNHIWFTASVFIAIALAATVALAQDAASRLSIRVVDISTNQPISGAIVVLAPSNQRGRTSSNGVFVFAGIAPGSYTVRCSAAGYQPTRTSTLRMAAGVAMRSECRMQPRPQRAAGRADKAAQERAEAPSAAADSAPRAQSKSSSRSRRRHQRIGAGVGSAGGVGSSRGGMVRPTTPRPASKRRIASHNVMVSRPPAETQQPNREGYETRDENPFTSPTVQPLSTFSIDVDTASYSNIRRMLEQERRLPPRDAVKIEELVNYFPYEYPEPTGADPFSVNTEISAAPWNPAHRLVRIGLQAKKLPMDRLPPSNLVFLLDVSGSMRSPAKLPLLKSALAMLVEHLRPTDRVAITVYAGAAGVVLPSTPGSDKAAILAALDRLQAGGSTAGAAGIELAYQVARENYIRGGNNRVILATDGDFNVGPSSDAELVRVIEKKRQQGVFLTVLGFGAGNYQDAKMEKLAGRGNGNHAYIDSLMEARKVLVSEMGGTLFTIAKDVKLQIELNPARVKGYRLIGYENRMLAAQDFRDDKKDAGELGAGHSVTAFYELIPAGSAEPVPGVDELKYQKPVATAGAAAGELMTIKLRYKKPNGRTSKLMSRPVADRVRPLEATHADFRFASAVVELGLLLRDSEHKGQASYQRLIRRAEAAQGADVQGYRAAFLKLAQRAASLAGSR